MSTNKSVARSATVISFATLISRILWFIRDMVIARLFGVYAIAQAFVIAFRIPNLFRDFIGEGATNAAFVPVFTEYHLKRTKEEFWHLANIVLNALLVALSIITLLGVAFSPFIVRLMAPGFVSDPQKFAATITLTRWIFPYLLLICLAAYAMGILNSLKHFALPAFAPCLLNISIIIFALLFGEGIKGLALGVLVGGVLQLAVQVPLLYFKGMRWRPQMDFNHPGLRQIFKLMVPRTLSSGIYQLNNFVDSIFGSLVFIVGEGGVAVLYFSYRLIQFPLGLFSTALSQAILPTFSAQALEKDSADLRRTLSWGLRATFFVLIPASVAFIVLAKPIVATIFGGGKFDSYSSDLTASALVFYSIGLFAYGAKRIIQSCFFALKDTITPTKIAGLALLLNIILNTALMFPLKIAGIALATSLSGIISCAMLLKTLRNRIGDFGDKQVALSFLKILASSIAMGIVCYFVSRHLAGMNKFLQLAIEVAFGMLSYIIFCLFFRVSELGELLRWVFRKK